MAFVNKIGNVLKQTVSKNANFDLSASNSSIYQAIRCMSSKLFVGGISYNTDETSLREAFAQYGDVTEAKVILDRETGQSRGFGFVSFTTEESASSAMQALDGQDLHGRRVRVSYANERTSGFRGGFGGDSGYGGGANNYRSGGNYGGVNSYGSGGDADNYGSNSYGGGANNFRSEGNYGGDNNYGSGGDAGNYGGDNNYGSGGDAGNYGSNSYGGGENRYATGETSGFGGGNSNYQQQ